MPYKDPLIAREKLNERKRKLRTRKKIERFGNDPGDLRGRHKHHPRGSNSYLWNDGRLLSRDGYVLLRVGKTHPFADPNGYCREHVLIWYSAGHKHIPGEVVHHLNGDRKDNRLENLKAIPIELHNRIHNTERGRDKKGRFLPRHKAAGRLLDGREWNEFPK